MTPKSENKNLFDYLRAVTTDQKTNYWSELSETERKSFSVYMINRYLSMNDEWVELVDDLQPYTIGNQLDPELVYKMYIGIIPPTKIFLKYIKSTSDKYEKELLQIFMEYYHISQSEATDYVEILFSTDDGKKEMDRILKMHAYDDKEIKKLIKIKAK